MAVPLVSIFLILYPLTDSSHIHRSFALKTCMNAGQVPILKKKNSTVAVLISFSLSAIL